MTDYQALRIEVTPCSETVTDLLAAFLADEGYESFVPDDKGLTAYIDAARFNPEAVEQIIADFPMEIEAVISDETVEGRDWNKEWEQHYFKPIVVGGKCVVHSTFHTDVPQAEYDIVIDPKMAFGTGHHATTALIIEYLLDTPLAGKSVIDMGTGTGILAILSHKLGANRVTGIEIDRDAWENAVYHTEINNAREVTMLHGDASTLADLTATQSPAPTADFQAAADAPSPAAADLLLANINRNIILTDIHDYAAALKLGGIMILSGFYTEDVPLLTAAAARCGLTPIDQKTRDNWCALRLRRTSITAPR